MSGNASALASGRVVGQLPATLHRWPRKSHEFGVFNGSRSRLSITIADIWPPARPAQPSRLSPAARQSSANSAWASAVGFQRVGKQTTRSSPARPGPEEVDPFLPRFADLLVARVQRHPQRGGIAVLLLAALPEIGSARPPRPARGTRGSAPRRSVPRSGRHAAPVAADDDRDCAAQRPSAVDRAADLRHSPSNVARPGPSIASRPGGGRRAPPSARRGSGSRSRTRPLVFLPAGADAELEPPAADDVDRRRHLRGEGRVAEPRCTRPCGPAAALVTIASAASTENDSNVISSAGSGTVWKWSNAHSDSKPRASACSASSMVRAQASPGPSRRTRASIPARHQADLHPDLLRSRPQPRTWCRVAGCAVTLGAAGARMLAAMNAVAFDPDAPLPGPPDPWAWTACPRCAPGRRTT